MHDDTAPATSERRWLPPWWTLLFPLLSWLGTGVWKAASASGEMAEAFAQGLVWPGLAVAGAVLLMVWLGWVLDID